VSKAISVKLKDEIFNEAEEMTKRIRMSRNAYINNAISFYTRMQERLLLRKQLHEESAIVSEDSLSVLREFEELKEELFE